MEGDVLMGLGHGYIPVVILFGLLAFTMLFELARAL